MPTKRKKKNRDNKVEKKILALIRRGWFCVGFPMTLGCGSEWRVEAVEPTQRPPWERAGEAGGEPCSQCCPGQGHGVNCVAAIAQHCCLDTVSCKDFKLPLY